jgi:hypothetical protein
MTEGRFIPKHQISSPGNNKFVTPTNNRSSPQPPTVRHPGPDPGSIQKNTLIHGCRLKASMTGSCLQTQSQGDYRWIRASCLSCRRLSSSNANIAPLNAQAISDWVSQTYPWVPRNASAASSLPRASPCAEQHAVATAVRARSLPE